MRLASLAVLVFAVAAGCSSSSGGSGAGDPCSAAKPCQSGEVCDLTDPDGPICIDGSGDLDGDGLDNAHDFCDHVAGGGADEDGDGIGDLCDKCPIAAPPSTPDTDGDDVDSPCDPYPDAGGDKIFLFDGFNGTFGSNWTPSPATAWQFEGGELVATNGSADAIMTFPLPTTSDRFAIETAYRVDSIADGTFHEISIGAADKRPAGVAVMTCGAERTTTGDELTVNTDQMSSADDFSNLFDPAGLYQFTARQDGSLAGCVMINGNEAEAVQTLVTADTMSQVDFDVHGATTRFEYILIVGH